MKKPLSCCLFVLLLVAGAAVLGYFRLPDDYEIERRLEIAASPAAVYAVVSDLHTWPEWTIWNPDLDPQAVFSFPEQETGSGARMSWTGPKMGQGDLVLLECEAPRRVPYDVAMSEGQHRSQGWIEIEEVPGGSLVYWVHAGKFDGVVKLFGPWLDAALGQQFEDSLMGLKERVEPLIADPASDDESHE